MIMGYNPMPLQYAAAQRYPKVITYWRINDNYLTISIFYHLVVSPPNIPPTVNLSGVQQQFVSNGNTEIFYLNC